MATGGLNLNLEDRRFPEESDAQSPANHPGAPPEGLTQSGPHQGYALQVLQEGDLQNKFLCVKCTRILRDPIQSQCGHRYCRGCYKNFTQGREGIRCPACIEEGDGDEDFASLSSDRTFPDHAIRRDIGAQSSKCINAGCSWTGLFRDYLGHETECRYRPVLCNCGQMVPAVQLEDHKETACMEREVQCLHCETKVKAKDLPDHESVCAFYPFICKDCGSKMARELVAKHQDPISGDCTKMPCPHGCEETFTPEHQRDNVVPHLGSLLQKVVALESRIAENVPRESQQSDHLVQRVEVIEGQMTGLVSRVDSEMAKMRQDYETHGHAVSDSVSRNSPGVSIQVRAATEVSTQIRTTPGVVTTDSSPHDVQVLAEKQATVESLVAVLNRQMEKLIVEFDGMENQHRLATDQLDQQQQKITHMERTLCLKDITIAEQELRLQALENICFDGTLVWRIPDYSRKKSDAISGRAPSIYSSPFYTSRSGYRMCARIYLNGDGMGRGTHISLFFVVMRSPFDAILTWPFKQKVTMMLLDQSNKEHQIDAFRPDPTSSSFRRPQSDMNIASGCPLFCPLSKLEDRKYSYVKDDAIFIKIIVDQQGI